MDLSIQSTSSDRLRTGLKIFAGGVCRGFSNPTKPSKRNGGLKRGDKHEDESSDSSCDDIKVVKENSSVNRKENSIFNTNGNDHDFAKSLDLEDSANDSQLSSLQKVEQSEGVSDGEKPHEPKDKGRPRKASKPISDPSTPKSRISSADKNSGESISERILCNKPPNTADS